MGDFVVAAPVDAEVAQSASSHYGAHLVMFWVLVGMAAIVFAPCVLIPIWLETEALVRTEASIAAHNARLQEHISEQRRLIDALRSDPLVNERIARRDLRFRRPGEEVQPVADAPMPDVPRVDVNLPPDASAVTPDPQPSAVVRWSRRWLPNLPWVDLFGRPPNRTYFLVMAGVLVVAAFVLFGHAGERRQGSSADKREI